MADERFFDLEIITPDRVFWKGQAFMLELNTTEGQVGIYKRHIPMTMIVAPGIMTIHLDGFLLFHKQVLLTASLYFMCVLPMLFPLFSFIVIGNVSYK